MNFPFGHITALSDSGMGEGFHVVVLALQITVALMLLYAFVKLAVSLWSRS